MIDTAPLDLDEIIAEIDAARTARATDVARVHSGDPSLYGAIAEQMRRLDALGIGYDVTPGVPAFAAAAAALGQELTLPGIAQSVVLTRTAVRASPMPARRDPGRVRRDRRDARDPSLDQQPRPRGARACCRSRRRTARSPWSIARPGRTSAIIRGTLADDPRPGQGPRGSRAPR